MKRGLKAFATRAIAFLLIAGGILGLVGSYLMGFRFIEQHQYLRLASLLVAAFLFVCSIPAGVGLWQKNRYALQWAKLLFALQIPVFSFSRFTYEFSTFFSLRVMIGDTMRHIGADIGSSSNISILPESAGTLIGINVIAVLAVIYLSAISRTRMLTN